MSKATITDLINKKIKGQGTAIDAGSVMPEILGGIMDLIPEGIDTLQFSSADGTTVTQSAAQKTHNTPILDKIKAGTLTQYLVDIDVTNEGHYIGFGNSTITSSQFTILLYVVGLNTFINSKIILYTDTYLVESSFIGRSVYETQFQISDSGTTEGKTTTYEVTTSQAAVDAFTLAAVSNPLEARPVVINNGAVIRFTKIEVAEGSVTGHCRIDGGTYALHLMDTDLGGQSYFSYTTD